MTGACLQTCDNFIAFLVLYFSLRKHITVKIWHSIIIHGQDSAGFTILMSEQNPANVKPAGLFYPDPTWNIFLGFSGNKMLAATWRHCSELPINCANGLINVRVCITWSKRHHWRVCWHWKLQQTNRFINCSSWNTFLITPFKYFCFGFIWKIYNSRRTDDVDSLDSWTTTFGACFQMQQQLGWSNHCLG